MELPGLEASGARAIAERLAVMVGGRVLDVCTGKGDFIEMLMKTLKEFDCFVGVDIADDDLAVAREKFQDRAFQFFEMDAEHLDFVDISFDMVCIANSLHHLTNMSRVLTEMKRVLKPGGWFIVEEMYRDGEQSEAQRTGILEHHWTAKVDRLLGVPHNETLTKNQIVQALDVLQFKNLEVLDSSRRVKCLFCPDRFDCEDPKSESNVTSFIKGIDKTLQQLAPNERLANIVEEAEQLKLLVQKTGFADASIVFVIGRK
ncbi:MAG: class I SAM-dependent methyltransferase [Promethearchaeota archaeon]